MLAAGAPNPPGAAKAPPAAKPVVDLQPLLQARDEVRVRLHLAGAELREEWERAEVKWARLEGEVERLKKEAKRPSQEILRGARGLLEDLSDAYARIGAALKRPA